MFCFDDCLHLGQGNQAFGREFDFALRVNEETAGNAVYKIIRPGHSFRAGCGYGIVNSWIPGDEGLYFFGGVSRVGIGYAQYHEFVFAELFSKFN